MSLEAALARADELADRTFAGWKVPGVAYGLIVDGELRHVRGLGTAVVGEDRTPDADTVFRIASMTKSFTAATVLLLRDEGRLRLDDPIAVHLPRLAGLRGPTADSPAITIRHLLTMTAGFPTDDPWGDRQQGLDPERFLELAERGLSFAWAPGTHFEYSNLGYGLLGRLITAVAGREYREVVTERLLAPLRMSSSTYLQDEVDRERLARGYVWRDTGYLAEPIDGYGALAAMGGLFTSVRDLASWVRGFSDAFPPRDDAGLPEPWSAGHPLARASRREMQQPMISFDPAISFPTPDADPEFDGAAYGFGLFVEDHLRWGRIAGHSGGYPGYGSNMRWHAASGLGTIVLANGRYAPATRLGQALFSSLLEDDAAPSRRIRPSAATLAARSTVEGLLRQWDDATATKLFAMNVELDEPVARRRALVARLAATHGRLEPDASEAPISRSPFHLQWWLRGERGRVKAEILLSPEWPPLVQTLNLTSVPEAPAALRAAAERIAEVLVATDGASPGWPTDLPLAPGVDAEALARAMRAAEARFGTVRLGPVIAGDGLNSATFRLECRRGALDLALERDDETGTFSAVKLTPVRMAPADYD
ncbi:MAG TPA: serine hydrolase domain-containing protein [Candidatus Limnocylindrales bacterium]|nr:serine hydrolase domain-containing protein [Candidatus Limnocylindrales bacterium]